VGKAPCSTDVRHHPPSAEALGIDFDWLVSGQGPEPGAASADPCPNRTEAARLARLDGIYETAIQRVLAEPLTPETSNLSVLAWARRMKLSELTMTETSTRPAQARRKARSS
jgi:hypothetical protein